MALETPVHRGDVLRGPRHGALRPDLHRGPPVAQGVDAGEAQEGAADVVPRPVESRLQERVFSPEK